MAKVTRNVVRRKDAPSGTRTVFKDYVWSETSPRDRNGKLVLRSNPMQQERKIEMYNRDWFSQRALDYYRIPDFDAFPSLYGPGETAASDKATANFRRKLHRGDSSLGVTLGSAGQSLSMVTSKLNLISSVFKRIKNPQDYRKMRKSLGDNNLKKALGSGSRSAANAHLEVVFGWVPLFADAASAMEVLCGDIPHGFIRASGSSTHNVEVVERPTADRRYLHRQQWSSRVSLSAHVNVSNPNVWLLNRLGLVNPAVVAWDLIPWSFVVGMFVNVTEVIKSYTDFVGLDLTDYATTYTHKGVVHTEETFDFSNATPPEFGFVQSGYVVKKKVRTVGGSPPRPSLQFRLPNVDLGLAAIAASLVTQQASRIGRMIGVKN